MSSDARYELRLPRAEKEELQARADSLGVSLSEAFRKGADLWLAARESDQPGEYELVDEIRALANKVDRRLRGR